MQCPHCHNEACLIKKGFYVRPSDLKKIRRYQCKICRKWISDQWWSHEYRLRKRRINQEIFNLICRGMSQRAVAEHLNVKREAIARRMIRFGRCSKANLESYRLSRNPAKTIEIDEMESFEKTKCKPLTIPIAVEHKTRKILALQIGRIAPKGQLTEKAFKKYGHIVCERNICLKELFKELQLCVHPQCTIKSDKSYHYLSPIKTYFPEAKHLSFKGRKPKETGLGELKKGGFDPIFSINHSLAMFRDNLKTLSRKTWCTSKKIERLENLLYMYSWFHNKRLDRPRKRVHLAWEARCN